MKTAHVTIREFEVMRALRKGQGRPFILQGEIAGEDPWSNGLSVLVPARWQKFFRCWKLSWRLPKPINTAGKRLLGYPKPTLQQSRYGEAQQIGIELRC